MIRLPYNGIKLRLLSLRSSKSRVNQFSQKDDSCDEKGTKKYEQAETSDKHDKNSGSTKECSQEEESATVKLNRLLASMATDGAYSVASSHSPKLPTPGNSNIKIRNTIKEELTKKDAVVAVKNVASMLDAETQQHQTESELLAKLLGHRKDNMKEDQDCGKKKVALCGLSELIVGMKIDRSPHGQEKFARSNYARKNLAAARNRQQTSDGNTSKRTNKFQAQRSEAESYTGSVNLYGAEELGIFKIVSSFKESADSLNTWHELRKLEFKLQSAHPPANYFEQLALKTEEGKAWEFPIDNEQDWKIEEADVDFSEHIFLEQHIEAWCPEKGPIRHFMELVCVGLSKNPYLSAREKKDHILWYRDYFENKKELLKDYMRQEKPKYLTEKQQS